MSAVWMAALLAAAIYCAVRGFMDFKAKRYGWAICGAAAAITLFSVPIPTHADKIELPLSGR
ncbi:hypothetical protein [uncultured Sphingomonas sp.]|uniref:hypothetical protein n=1 Tax=uncultured Sphingomonas sp. TaxID=158754 RepID=UPI0025D9CDFF|nr:hypothetical protein [uncultured Sphingomonas sp.]